MMSCMHSQLMPLPVPDVIELLEFPTEFGGLPEKSRTVAEAVRASAALARKRLQQLQVIELESPSTTTFALFL